MKERQTARFFSRKPRGAKALCWLAVVAVCLVLPHDGAGAAQARKTVEEAIIDLLEVRPGMVAAEIGAGNGDLAVRLAGLVGPDGRVYANEIDPAMIELINKKKASGNVANLTVVLSQETDPVLPEQADRILLVWVYHHLSKPDEFMASLPKYLKSDGWLAVVAVDVRSAKKGAAEKDPCVSDPVEAQAAIERAGFSFRRLEHLQGYPAFYMLTFERAPTALPQQLSPRDPATILRALNEIVATHAYGQPKLELAADGLIVRKNSDGSVFRFKLRDIGEMRVDREGEAHVLLPCRGGTRCVERQLSASAAIQQIDTVVFSMYPADRGAEVLQLFRDLQAALTAPTPPRR